MSIRAVFPNGATTTTTDKLHQWDYGQTLAIEAYDLPLVQEVHFACPEMTEAIVRPCSTTNGVVTVKVPDICLERASTITAWVFVIEGEEGMTKKTITIPVEKRTKPSPSSDVPVDLMNTYTELITEINEAVAGLTNGDITAMRANTAGSAATAGMAVQAETANLANKATALTLEERTTIWYAPDGIYVLLLSSVGSTSLKTSLIVLNKNDISVGEYVIDSAGFVRAYRMSGTWEYEMTTDTGVDIVKATCISRFVS